MAMTSLATSQTTRLVAHLHRQARRLPLRVGGATCSGFCASVLNLQMWHPNHHHFSPGVCI
ncbi:hypothetical protein P692DRAFT_20828893 [Suillus brevipes Sb2]|nr:hypothetical protein P692DRAFT_20828893 [Suillus brevipes Sb2]